MGRGQIRKVGAACLIALVVQVLADLLDNFQFLEAMQQLMDGHGISFVHALPPPPTALTDVELRRLAHRLNGVASVHDSENYRWVKCALLCERPPSPDPTARGVSKLSWEIAMQQWREALEAKADDVKKSKTLSWLAIGGWSI